MFVGSANCQALLASRNAEPGKHPQSCISNESWLRISSLVNKRFWRVFLLFRSSLKGAFSYAGALSREAHWGSTCLHCSRVALGSDLQEKGSEKQSRRLSCEEKSSTRLIHQCLQQGFVVTLRSSESIDNLRPKLLRRLLLLLPVRYLLCRL